MNKGERKSIPPATANGLMTFGEMQVDKRIVFAATPLLVSLLVGLAITLSRPVPEVNLAVQSHPSAKGNVNHDAKKGISVETTKDLIRWLQQAGLWEIPHLMEIPQVVFTNFPSNFHKLTDMPRRKKVFLHTLLPLALIALREVREERALLEDIIVKLGRPIDNVSFSSKENWQSPLNRAEIDFIERLTKKYRTRNGRQLFNRVDVIPVSLILAQGAVESSWGGSRFARTGNNIFGIWTWEERGIIPAAREEGKNHKVKVYDSILDSVRSYILMLNRLPAYRRFRELRQQTDDSLLLAEGLLHYSERREMYIRELQQVINYNRLKKYDQYLLAAVPLAKEFKLLPYSYSLQARNDQL